MKNTLTKIFWPILKFFETDEEPANYKKSHRVALNVLGGLFIFLSLVSSWAAYSTKELGALIPVVVFLCVGLVAVVVGSIGSNAAVCKIWGTK
ncbi:MAG: UDP-N-acetylmuramyl pentapeptide phosphotransferase/UDP-N-acetylglucosamine-1-phosphate transferase [Cryomorphaceae bacterium]|jgi:UDP-N-acetylmuramyl pentapeptide phosphotransferase/UDP-N-acetylglucosamine-1-phosphate transferase